MAWPKLRKRRSSTRLVTFTNRGEAQTPSPTSGESGESVRLIWPGTNGAVTARAGQAPQAAGSAPQAAGSAEDHDDLPFWDWSSDQSELDDPSDAFAPDRPEYPDGPDYPDYRASGSAGAPWLTPASPETGGSRGARGSAASRESGESRDSGADKGLRRPQEPVISTVSARPDELRREGIGQHLGSLAHLSGDPRRRAWLWRAVIAIVVAVAFSILANWLVGLSLAVLAVIADTIIRSRRAMVGPDGVRHAAAQRRTRRQLGKLERAGYRAMHNVPITGSDDQIDHLVIGPAGVFSIDSEAWDRRLPVRTKSGRQLWHGPFSMKDRLEHARRESEWVGAQLSSAVGTQVTVRPAMAVYGPRLPWDVATIRDVDVFKGPRVRRYLRRVARHGDTRLLSDGEIERIDRAAQTAFLQAAGR